ncbi:HBR278Cp [Eremothecium sinecaudum]|uniref:Protein BCP1 n=1 Tax=Eremothecium sinecaudum TaxID=45286 RepID=A0A109UX87_9SACH|nr:HBR278Cp [Eremothecium sinecaudum]AMD19179.1 HBR278Cp [Eremothecium sinecaudum]
MVQAIKLSQLAKRKREEAKNAEVESDASFSVSDSDSGEDSDDQDEGEIINIDFDFFNANPDIDFHSVKNLLRQLFGAQTSNMIQLSALTDLALASPMTTIKTDGQESDPYCFLSFINYKENKNSNYAKFLSKVDPKISNFLSTIDNSHQTCALVLCERLINMPAELIPPLYRTTLEDIEKSSENGKHFDFYLIVSRKYEVNFDMDSDDDDDDEDQDSKPRKRVKAAEVDYFHEEDRYLEKNAEIHIETGAKKGIIASYIVIDHDGLVKAIQELQDNIASWK